MHILKEIDLQDKQKPRIYFTKILAFIKILLS